MSNLLWWNCSRRHNLDLQNMRRVVSPHYGWTMTTSFHTLARLLFLDTWRLGSGLVFSMKLDRSLLRNLSLGLVGRRVWLHLFVVPSVMLTNPSFQRRSRRRRRRQRKLEIMMWSCRKRSVSVSMKPFVMVPIQAFMSTTIQQNRARA